MMRPTIRSLVMICGATAGLFAYPAESHAIFHWCRRCTTPAPTYAPVAAYSPCTSCQQTVNYVPQTYYRPTYVNVPVTTYSPVVSTNPCNGCGVTSYRPVTSYVQQVRYTPYTTYRLVYSPAGCSTCAPVTARYAPACSTCAPTTTSYAPAAAATSSCCTPTSYSAPAASSSSLGVTSQPTLNGGVTTNYPTTNGAQPQTESRLRPTPVPDPATNQPTPADANGGASHESHSGESHDANGAQAAPMSAAPNLVFPDPRTASRPYNNIRGFQRTSYKPAAAPAQQTPVHDDGWRPSNR